MNKTMIVMGLSAAWLVGCNHEDKAVSENQPQRLSVDTTSVNDFRTLENVFVKQFPAAHIESWYRHSNDQGDVVWEVRYYDENKVLKSVVMNRQGEVVSGPTEIVPGQEPGFFEVE